MRLLLREDLGPPRERALGVVVNGKIEIPSEICNGVLLCSAHLLVRLTSCGFWKVKLLFQINKSDATVSTEKFERGLGYIVHQYLTGGLAEAYRFWPSNQHHSPARMQP
jgi:hypothetical protein